VTAQLPARGVCRHALTLIELLTSVSTGLLLTALATVAFLQVRTALLRLHARLEMHDSARLLYQALSEQFSALQQDAATWVESTQDDGSGDGTVGITFLKGKTDEHGYTTSNGDIWNGEQYSVYQNRCCDLEWASWLWDQRRSILSVAANSPPHQFLLQKSWKGPQGDYGQSVFFVYMPQPLRMADPYPLAAGAGGSQAALGGNRYGSPDEQNDLSDYQDLKSQMSPALRNVSGFAVELILADGSVVDVSNRQARTVGMDGVFVDGHCAATASGAVPYRGRPRMIRLLIDMTDPQTRLSQSFSFTFQLPGLLPLAVPLANPAP
jgi:hypothetical protein